MKMDIGVVELCLTRFPQDVMVGSILKQNFRIVERKKGIGQGCLKMVFI